MNKSDNYNDSMDLNSYIKDLEEYVETLRDGDFREVCEASQVLKWLKELRLKRETEKRKHEIEREITRINHEREMCETINRMHTNIWYNAFNVNAFK